MVSPSWEEVVFGDGTTLCDNADDGPPGASRFGPFEEILVRPPWCRLLRAATSRGSLTVSNLEHVWSLNCRMRRPNSLVRRRRCSNVLSVCILDLARACHSAVQYNSPITCLLCGSSSRSSNTGMEHCNKSLKSHAASFFISDTLLLNLHMTAWLNGGVCWYLRRIRSCSIYLEVLDLPLI